MFFFFLPSEPRTDRVQYAYCAASPLAASYSYQFAAEAERMWQGDRTTDSLPSLVGLSFLFLFHGSHGQGELAQARLQDLAEMAPRMNLFGTPNVDGIKGISSLALDVQYATAFAGWGVFNLIS